MKFATFFYPGYYQCRLRNLAAGTSIDEWALLRREVRSVFAKTADIVPLLGYTDCSEPAVVATEADLAHYHGIDAFIFNFYFDGVVAELERPLEVIAQLETKLEFGINLCCHMPKRKLPFGVGEDYVAPYSYWSEEQFRQLAKYLCDKYVIRTNYFRCDGRAVITLYHVNAFKYLYGPEGLTRRVNTLREICLQSGIHLHIIGLFSVVGGWNRHPADAQSLPFDSYSCYVALPDFESNDPVQSFPKLAAKWLTTMAEKANASLQQIIVPCVGAGWNATSRGETGYDPNTHGLRFPYHPIVVDDDPNAFEEYLGAAADRALGDSQNTSGLLLLGPWNEWSEGCYLLPDERFGLGKLQAVMRVKHRVRDLVGVRHRIIRHAE